MTTTLVGIFDDYSAAQRAVQELTKAGIKQGEISIARNEPAGQGYTTYGGANSTDYTTGTSIGDKISNFFDGIFGTDINDDERGVYSEAVRRGSTIVVVNSDETETAAEILNRAGAVDVDRRQAQYRSAGYQNFDAKAPLYNAEQTSTELQSFAAEKEIALPVIEEELAVGKRVVQRGAVRVHTRVIERPVEESVTLREEHVNVERHKVDRAATDADFAAVKEGEINLTTRAEEAVVAKQAHVVEEVVIGKQVTERDETIRETVKRTEVDVEETDVQGQSKKARQ